MIERVIKKRKSVRRYLDKKPDWKKILHCIDSARFAPMAGNQFALKFILVSDEEKIYRISKACQQDFVAQAKYLVVFVSDDEKVSRSYGEKSEMFARQQAGAAIENFLLTLTEKGLATCWVGWFDSNQIKSVLKIPETSFVEAVFPIGFETKVKTTQKPKPELSNLIYFNQWKNKYMEANTRITHEDA